jgi:hypothetical protein
MFFKAMLEGKLVLMFCATNFLIPLVSSLSTNSFYMTRIRNYELPFIIMQEKEIIACSILILFPDEERTHLCPEKTWLPV